MKKTIVAVLLFMCAVVQLDAMAHWPTPQAGLAQEAEKPKEVILWSRGPLESVYSWQARERKVPEELARESLFIAGMLDCPFGQEFDKDGVRAVPLFTQDGSTDVTVSMEDYWDVGYLICMLQASQRAKNSAEYMLSPVLLRDLMADLFDCGIDPELADEDDRVEYNPRYHRSLSWCAEVAHFHQLTPVFHALMHYYAEKAFARGSLKPDMVSAHLEPLVAHTMLQQKRYIALEKKDVFRGHTGAVRHVAFNADDSLLLSGSEDSTAKVWNVADGAYNATLKEGIHGVGGSAFGDDGQIITMFGDVVRVWDSATERVVATLLDQSEVQDLTKFFKLRLSKDHSTMLAAGEKGKLNLLDVKTGNVLASYELPYEKTCADGHERSCCVNDAQLSPDEKLVACSLENHVVVFNAETGELVQTLRDITPHSWTPIRSVRFTKDSKKLLTAAYQGGIALWDIKTGKRAVRLPYADTLKQASFSNTDEDIVAACGSNGHMHIWQLSSGKRLQQIQCSEDSAVSLAWSSDDKQIAVGTKDNTIVLWQFLDPVRVNAEHGYVLTVEDVLQFEHHMKQWQKFAGQFEGNQQKQWVQSKLVAAMIEKITARATAE